MVPLLRSQLLESAGFPLHGFTTRAGGVSTGPYATLNLAHNAGDDPAAVVQNLRRLRETLVTDLPLLRVDQVHGSRVADVGELPPNDDPWIAPPTVEADALVDGAARGVLAVQVADCAPVLLADPASGAVGAVHAGWRGAANGVLRNTVRAMTARSVSSAMWAWRSQR